MKLLNRLSILILISFSLSQDSFELEIESTGVSQLIIFQNSITGLESGDQIGVFDSEGILNSGDCSNQYGELLVGVNEWLGDQVASSSIG